MPSSVRRDRNAAEAAVAVIGIGPEPAAGTTADPAPILAQPSSWVVVAAATVGAAVAFGLGVYGQVHQPTGVVVAPLRPENLLAVKSTLTTVGVLLAMFQLVSACWLYGRLGSRPAPRWLGPAHRWSGTAAFVVTLPAAYHCLWGLGFQSTTTRVLIHSVLGCAFYGAFATKLLLLRSSRLPGWALPAAGGALVTLMVSLWFSSAWWWFLR